jgi:hypothetical protein
MHIRSNDFRLEFEKDVRCLCKLFDVSSFPKDGPVKIISIGSGLCQELAALLMAFGNRLEYVGIDISGDYCVLAENIYSKLKTEKIHFVPANAAQLFGLEHGAFIDPSCIDYFKKPKYSIDRNYYNGVFFRHPFLYDDKNPQYSDFSQVIKKIVPRLVKEKAALFATFFTETENQRFIQHFNEQGYLSLANQTINTRKIDDNDTSFSDPEMPAVLYKDHRYILTEMTFTPKGTLRIEIENLLAQNARGAIRLYENTNGTFLASRYATPKTGFFGPYRDNCCYSENTATMIAEKLNEFNDPKEIHHLIKTDILWSEKIILQKCDQNSGLTP